MTNLDLTNPSSIRLMFHMRCCFCKQEEVHAPKLVDPFGLVDSDPIQVRMFNHRDWTSDGLGGWAHIECERKAR